MFASHRLLVRLFPICAGATLIATGCASYKAREVTPAIVDSALEELTTAESEARLRQLLALLEVRDSARDFARGFIEASASELADSAKREPFLKFSEEFAARLAASATADKDESTARLVATTLHALGTRENGARLREIVAQLGMRALAAEVASGFVEGSAHALTGAGASDAMAALTSSSAKLVAAMSHELAQNLERELGPVLRAQLVTSVQEIWRAVLKGDNRAIAADFAASLSTSMTNAATRALARGLTEDLAPAVSTALGAALTPETNAALGQSAREVSRQAALGLSDALRGELGATLAHVQEEWWQRLHGSLADSVADGKATAERWLKIAIAGGVVLAIAVLALAISYLRARRLLRTREGASA
ncbi:MAG: hypothetical protein ACKVX7_18560 [Planctomycetota bacterium]